MLFDHLWGLLNRAEKSGALVPFKFHLDADQKEKRRIWMRRNIILALNDSTQVERNALVTATLEEFVLGEEFVMITKEAKHRSVDAERPDIKELNFDPPPFVEIRLRPQRRDLRLFGFFISKDHLILTHWHEKDRGTVGQIPTAHLRARSINELKSANITESSLVQDIRDCMEGVTYYE